MISIRKIFKCLLIISIPGDQINLKFHQKNMKILAIMSWIVYIFLTLIYHDSFGYHILIMSLLPISLTSSFWGSKRGSIGAIGMVSYHLGFLFFTENVEMITQAGFIGGSTVSVLLAWTVGTIKDVNDDLNQELRRRKKIENELEKSKEKIKKLHKTVRNLKECESEEEIFDLIVKASEKILEFEICEIEIPEDGNMVVKTCSSKFPDEGLDPVPIDDSIAGKTYQKNESYLISDIQKHDLANPSANTHKSGISVPIGKYGVFQATSNTKDKFDQEDLEIIELLAGHATEALKRLETNKKEEFLHSLLRHDVKNKISLIQGYQKLMDDLDLPEKAKEYLDKAKEETDISMEIIDKISTLKKMEDEETGPVEIKNFLEQAIKRNKPLASKKDVQLEVNYEECVVEAGLLLEEMFSNLIENSLVHSECSKIRISTEEKKEKFIVTIEDDGEGISEDIEEKIFEKGFKTEKSSGSGLGMYLVNKIAENYNGKIELFDSKLGGAGFKVHLEKYSDE